MRNTRSSRRGFTLVEVGVATFIITVVAMAGFAYYSTARVAEIREWHEQNSLFLCEREVEAWQAEGYAALAGFGAADCGPTNFLPYGYRFGSPDPEWNVGNRSKDVVLDGVTYRIRAHNLYNANTGNDYYTQETWAAPGGPITYYYRRLNLVVQWGGLSGTTSTWSSSVETRMAR